MTNVLVEGQSSTASGNTCLTTHTNDYSTIEYLDSVGITINPDTAWMMQVAKNVTDVFGGFLLGR